MNLSRSNQGRVLFLSLLIAGAAVVPGRAQSSANPDANVSTVPQIYGSEPREPEEQPEDNQKGRSLYENPRRMQQLSGAARSSLERRYGRQKPAPIQPAKTAVAQPGELLGAITNVLVNDPGADGTSHDTQNETSVALGSGLNVIAAFNDSGSLLVGSNHFTGYAVSTNGGISFLDRGVLPNSPEGDTGDPVLAHALGVGNIPDTVYLCTLGAVTFERVQLFRSFNNGLTFAAPVNATPGFTGSGDFQDKPWIAVDNYPGEGQGNVYLAWRNFPPSSSPGPGPYGIRFTRSTDGGAVWGPNRGVVIASEGVNNVQGAYVTVGPDHAVYVFWLDQSGGNGVPNAIKLRKSIDRGITFGPAVTAAILNNRNDNGDLGLEFRSDSFPQAAINPVNGNVYVVYNDDPPGGDRADVYFRRSTDGGLTWGGAVRVNDDVTSTDQYFPVLAVTPNGLRLFVGFYDRRLSGNNTLIDTFGVIADISGSNVVFKPNFRITTRSFPAAFNQDPPVSGNYMGDYDTAVADNTGFYYTWGDNRSGNTNHAHQPDVRFAKIPTSDLILTVPFSATEGDGLIMDAGRIAVPAPAAADLVIALNVDDPSQITVPASVTIPAGQTSNTFAITILDDAALDGTQVATITASATNHGEIAATVQVFDNETATLSVAMPTLATEGDGTLQGSVHVSAPVDANVQVGLVSSDTSEVEVPPFVVVPVGQTSAVFNVTIVDDSEIDGPQSATVTASVMNWTAGSATIRVSDNESTNLVLSARSQANEASGVIANGGSVRISGTLLTNLAVSLSSSDPARLTVPLSVTIPAGETAASFDFTLIDNPLVDGAEMVTVTARAAAFGPGTVLITVYDDESPVVPANPTPLDLSSQIAANIDLSWTSGELIVNGGFETGDFIGWSKQNTGSGDFVINDGSLAPPGEEGRYLPFEGHFGVVTSQTGPGQHVLYQDMTIPHTATSVFLRWADQIHNHADDFATNQYFRVEIRDTDDNLQQVIYSTQPGDPTLNDWMSRSIDISQYVGQTIRVAFVEEDNVNYFNVYLDDISVIVSTPGATTFEVYFGTRPNLGPGEFRGTTTNTTWDLPLLSPLTTYYWRIVARQMGAVTEGPVWQFTTRGLDHFDWSAISSPQILNQPFSATIVAKDEFNTTVSNFTGSVSLMAAVPTPEGLFFGDDFEDGDFADWTIGPGSYTREVTAQTAAGGTHSMTMVGGNQEHYDGISHPLDDITPDRIDFFVRARSNNLAGGYFVIGTSPENAGTAVFFYMSEGGRMEVVEDSSGSSHGVPYVANRWYKITFFFDWPAHTIAYYVDDNLVGANIPFRGNVDHLSTVWLYNFQNTQNWWDEIQFVGENAPVAVSISPTNSGSFSNGAWTGNIAVQEVVNAVSLQANDGAGHKGQSKPFDVLAVDDLAVTAVDSPDPVPVGANLTYTLTVINSGPSAATGVVLTNILPASASLVSFSPSQGSCLNLSGTIQCNLGTLAGGANAVVTIVVSPTVVGSITNRTVVSRNGLDGYLPNNTVTTTTRVTPPALSVLNGSVAEGNVGTTPVVLPVLLLGTHADTITVNYATGDGTARAGLDYVATNGSLTFSPSVSTQLVTVLVKGDTLIESNETFFVNLSNAINAVIGSGRGTGTILDDDGLPGRVDHFAWNTVPSPQYLKMPFGVTITAEDAFNAPVTNFNQAVALSGSQAGEVRTNTFLGQVVAANNGSGSFTAGYSFTPKTNLMVTHVRHYSGSKVSIWTDAGVLLASQSVNSTPGVWVETPLTTPMLLSAGATYVVGFYTGNANGVYYWRDDLPSTLPDATISQAFETSGDSFPNGPVSVRWWLVDLRYTVGSSSPIGVTPVNSGNFVNGVWSGNMAAQAPATNLILLADDGDGHHGLANGFVVLLHDDLGVAVTDAPSPVAVGENLTYSMVVYNVGPSSATAVTLTDVIPANTTFVSVQSTMGSCSYAAGVVHCSFGTLSADTNVLVTLVVTPTVLGNVTNRVSIARDEIDAFAGNNSATNITSVQRVSLSIRDTAVVEGNSGITNAVFTVLLSPVTARTVQVNYATADEGATAGSDYLATNGTLIFAPGETSKTISVAVLGDLLWENDETFLVNLSSPSNAVVTSSAGTGRILNDDRYPTVSISNATVSEGNFGTVGCVFTVSLDSLSGQSVNVQYFTSDGTAIAPSDYISIPNASLTINPGQSNATFIVTVNGDTANELDETFFVYLYGSSGADIGDGRGVGTIVNDDFLPTIAAAGYEILAESCPDGAIDPNETVTVNFALSNVSGGNATTTNLIATLLAVNGVNLPSGPQEYGVLVPGDAPVARPFTFKATGTCGAPIAARLQLQDGTNNLGMVRFVIALGQRTTVFSENFDGVNAPALPAGWTGTVTGTGPAWRTTSDASDTAPNAVFAGDPNSSSDNQLTSPVISISTSSAQLSFSHSYDTESCCDHATLEISINGGAFNEITAAGGTFVSNGYESPGWSGSSGGFLTTIVSLPASASGRNVQLRWRLTSDSSVGGRGWYVDSISLLDRYVCCFMDDISVSVADSSDPVAPGGNLTYSITVTNTGPSQATNIRLTNTLPASATFVSVQSSQGACSNAGNIVFCNLGTLPGNTNATVTIVATPTTVGTLTDRVNITRGEADTDLGNNSATVSTTVSTPALYINDVSVLEGDRGITNALFTVVLSPSSFATVKVNYATANVTATAGGDYFGTNGILQFAPGETSKTIGVRIVGDIVWELDETFLVNLSNPSNAVLGRSQAVGTILNDDLFPSLSVSDISVAEGNTGTTNAVFRVSVFPPSSQIITVQYATGDGTAVSPSDYVATGNRSMTFNPFQTNGAFSVLVNGDSLIEPDEYFYVTLANANNADIARGQAVGNILNDDGLPGQLNHFAWDPIPSVQYMNQPFAVRVTAQDYFNGSLSNFNGTVAFTGNQGGGSKSGTMLDSTPHTGSFNTGTFTIGNGFTPSTNLTVTHVRHYFGTKVSIWTEAGVLLASQNVTSVPGSWIETPLPTPLQLTGGQSYRIGAYTAGLTYYDRFDGSNVFSDGTIDQAYYTSGDGFPDSDDDSRWVFVDLRYSVETSVPIAVTPATSGAFSNGIWTGMMTVLAPGTNVQLKADDRATHVGFANSFDVFRPGDLSLSISAMPDPVATNSPLTYVLSVFNPGPFTGTGVIVSNFLPAGVTFVSASSSQGSCSNAANVVSCHLGTLVGTSNATVQIHVVTGGTFGDITNRATVVQNEPDPNLANNSATAVTTVLNFPPTIRITSPFEGATFQFPQNVTITSAAFDIDGVVSKVEFFSNGSKLGETIQSPFTFIWTNASPGVDALTAKATDNGGKTATSGPVSITVFPPPPGSGIGVYGEYFDNLNFTSFVITEIDPVIDFDLTFGNFPPPSIAPTTFSVRWTGAVQPFYSDNYTFYTLSDDGVRLYIDGRLVIDNFTDHTPTENSGTISLQAGRLYSVRMEYYQNQNGASARLSWSSTNQFKQIIPQSQLYPLPMIATNPASAAVGVGANVTFAVAAYGQPPLTFQWRSNDVNIAGATGASLVVSNVQLGPPIGYSVMVGNTYGAVTSTLATLNVGSRPTMLEDPKSQIVLSGSNVSLNVSATGTLPLSYRWRKPPLITVLTNYILFASNSVWNIPNVQLNDAGTYTVVLTNLFGSATNRPVGQSSNAFVSVVSSQTTNIITDQGSNVSLLISAASSAALSYRWRFNLADILADATNSSLLLTNIQATNAGNYYGIVTNTAGAVTTLVATVAVVLRDSDHDGMPDDWEYIAGTDPYDPSSVLKLQLLDTGSNGALLRFLAMSNISYTLEYRTNLTQGPWRKLTDVGGQPGTNTVQILDPSIPTNSRRYYRIATPQRP